MPTVNELFLDALIRHQIYLMRFSGSLRDKILALLDATERDLEDTIVRRLAGNRGFDSESAARLRVLQRMITRLRGAAWDKVDDAMLGELVALAKYEPAFTLNALRAAAPVVVDAVIPSAELLRELVRSRPFEGKVLKDWAGTLRRDDVTRIMQQIQIGMVQGEDSRAIARRVVGTAQDRGITGVTELTRHHVQNVTRTAVSHISNQTRREFLLANAELFDEELFVATLDGRTTPECRAQDGKRYPVGKGPIPPLHFSCRSLRVAIVSGDALGERPFKAVTEQQLLREFLRGEGIDPVGIRVRVDLPRGSKAGFDRFARARVRELTGTVPAKTTYQQWLSRQSAQFQDDVLGKTRGALFRRGELTLDRFVNRQGDQLTLAQLAKRERKAFIRAGLDPNEF